MKKLGKKKQRSATSISSSSQASLRITRDLLQADIRLVFAFIITKKRSKKKAKRRKKKLINGQRTCCHPCFDKKKIIISSSTTTIHFEQEYFFRSIQKERGKER